MKCDLQQCEGCDEIYDRNNPLSIESDIFNVCKRCFKKIDDAKNKDKKEEITEDDEYKSLIKGLEE